MAAKLGTMRASRTPKKPIPESERIQKTNVVEPIARRSSSVRATGKYRARPWGSSSVAIHVVMSIIAAHSSNKPYSLGPSNRVVTGSMAIPMIPGIMTESR
jgi:hypothetical protein